MNVDMYRFGYVLLCIYFSCSVTQVDREIEVDTTDLGIRARDQLAHGEAATASSAASNADRGRAVTIASGCIVAGVARALDVVSVGDATVVAADVASGASPCPNTPVMISCFGEHVQGAI